MASNGISFGEKQIGESVIITKKIFNWTRFKNGFIWVCRWGVRLSTVYIPDDANTKNVQIRFRARLHVGQYLRGWPSHTMSRMQFLQRTGSSPPFRNCRLSASRGLNQGLMKSQYGITNMRARGLSSAQFEPLSCQGSRTAHGITFLSEISLFASTFLFFLFYHGQIWTFKPKYKLEAYYI